MPAKSYNNPEDPELDYENLYSIHMQSIFLN